MSLPSHLYYAVPIPPFFPLCSHSSPIVTQYPQFLVSPLSISSAQLSRYTCIFLFIFFLTWRGANCGYSFALCFFSPTYHYVLEFIPYQFTDIFLILFFTPAYSTPLCRCLIYLFNHSPMYQHLGGVQYFVITNNLIHMYSCIWGFFFPEGILLGQKQTCIYNLVHTAKLPSRRVVPVCSPTNNVWECLFPHSHVYVICCHTFKVLPIW